MGLLDYIDEDSSLFGGLFGSANSSPPVPPANIPGGDTSAMSTPVALAGGAGGIAPQGQISPALPQWVQTAQDPNRSAPPMAGLTQAQFNDRFGPVAKGSSPSGFSQSPAPSAVDDTSRFGDAKFDPQTYAGRSVSPSWGSVRLIIIASERASENIQFLWMIHQQLTCRHLLRLKARETPQNKTEMRWGLCNLCRTRGLV